MLNLVTSRKSLFSLDEIKFVHELSIKVVISSNSLRLYSRKKMKVKERKYLFSLPLIEKSVSLFMKTKIQIHIQLTNGLSFTILKVF